MFIRQIIEVWRYYRERPHSSFGISPGKVHAAADKAGSERSLVLIDATRGGQD